MKTQLLIVSALLAISSFACQAAPGTEARAAIPPDPMVSSSLTPAADFAPIAITPAPAGDALLWIHADPIAPELPVYLITGCDLQAERTAVRVAGWPPCSTHVLPLQEHGWYGTSIHYPSSHWRYHCTWHPADRWW